MMFTVAMLWATLSRAEISDPEISISALAEIVGSTMARLEITICSRSFSSQMKYCCLCSNLRKVGPPALSAVVLLDPSGSARKWSGSPTPEAINFLRARPSWFASRASSLGVITDQVSDSSQTRIDPELGGLAASSAWRALRAASLAKLPVTTYMKAFLNLFSLTRSSSHAEYLRSQGSKGARSGSPHWAPAGRLTA